jgi:hypothetical protein
VKVQMSLGVGGWCLGDLDFFHFGCWTWTWTSYLLQYVCCLCVCLFTGPICFENVFGAGLNIALCLLLGTWIFEYVCVDMLYTCTGVLCCIAV